MNGKERKGRERKKGDVERRARHKLKGIGKPSGQG